MTITFWIFTRWQTLLKSLHAFCHFIVTNTLLLFPFYRRLIDGFLSWTGCQRTITSSVLNWDLFSQNPLTSLVPRPKEELARHWQIGSDATDFTLKVILQPDKITDRWSCDSVGCSVLVLFCSDSRSPSSYSPAYQRQPPGYPETLGCRPTERPFYKAPQWDPLWWVYFSNGMYLAS